MLLWVITSEASSYQADIVFPLLISFSGLINLFILLCIYANNKFGFTCYKHLK